MFRYQIYNDKCTFSRACFSGKHSLLTNAETETAMELYHYKMYYLHIGILWYVKMSSVKKTFVNVTAYLNLCHFKCSLPLWSFAPAWIQ